MQDLLCLPEDQSASRPGRLSSNPYSATCPCSYDLVCCLLEPKLTSSCHALLSMP